jgi:ABC-2 type transport system ATP-binding protein
MSLLELDGITHNYGRVTALRDVTLRIEPGAIGLIGQNGAGKSTLLKILMGMLRPSRGEGRVLGLDVRRQSAALRVRLGFMPEAESLIPGVAGAELVALAGELSGMRRNEALRRAHEVLSYLGLEEVRYRRCEEYSVGMKQRLKLAAALVHDPELLLLDEPTAGLDPDGRESMLQLLKALADRHGKSLILSTHLLGDVDRVCSQVMIIDRGTVLGVGRIGDLRSSRRGRYLLRWQGNAEGYLAELDAGGVVLVANGQDRPGEATVDVPVEWSPRRFFELSVRHPLVLREVVPQDEDLPELYHRLIGKNGQPTSGGAGAS